jgi:hypothetical protein
VFQTLPLAPLLAEAVVAVRCGFRINPDATQNRAKAGGAKWKSRT